MSTRRFELSYGLSSLTVGYKVLDLDEQVLVALTTLPNNTSGKEFPPGSGDYFVEISGWNPSWQGVIYWYDNSVYIPGAFEQFGPGATSASVSGAGATGGVTVGELVTILRERGRNVGIDDSDDSVFSAPSKRLAIKTTLLDFVRRTRCTNQHDTIAIADTDTQVDFSGITGFHPELLKGTKLWIEDQNETVLPDLQSVLDARRWDPTTGSPEAFAFTDESTAIVWPTSDDAYTLNVQWAPPLTTFDINDAASDDVILNVPTDLAIRAIETGGVARLLQGKIEDVQIIAPLRKEYEDHVLASMGRGSISGDSAHRASGPGGSKWERFLARCQ